MPGMTCVVPGCKKRYVNTKLQNERKISFHHFPKNIDVRKIWVGRCLNEKHPLNPRSTVCSDHFCQEDFERDLKSELLGVKSRPRLKTLALPSLNLPFYKPPIKPDKEHQASTDVEKRKKIVEELLNCPTNSSTSLIKLKNSTLKSKQGNSNPVPIIPKVSSTNKIVNESTIPQGANELPIIAQEFYNSTNHEKIVKGANGLEKNVVKSYNESRSEIQIAEIAKLRILLEKRSKQITKTKKQYSDVRKKLLQKSQRIVNAEHNLTAAKLHIKRLKQQLAIVTKKKKQKDLLKEKSCEILKEIFTESQIKVLMGKKKVKWAEEDFANAFALRYINKQAYLFVRDKLNYPLPALSTLRRYAAIAVANRGAGSEILDEHVRDVYESELKAGVVKFDDDNSNDTENNEIFNEILNTENDDIILDNVHS